LSLNKRLTAQVLGKKDLENIFSYRKNVIADLFLNDNYNIYMKDTIVDIAP